MSFFSFHVAIIGRVKDALRKAGADKEYVDKYQDEVMCGEL
jgi:hypothetical protein